MEHKPENSVLWLDRNRQGRDFVVGDIHGHFELLELLLKEIAFDEEYDRIISVGDGIDRGPESERALEFWNQSWFYSVRGNHEEMLLTGQDYLSSRYNLWMDNGGEWAESVPESLLKEMVDCYSELPYAINVETELGQVGIVHADIPARYSWSRLLQKLSINKLKKRELDTLLWSRESYRKFRKSMESGGDLKESYVGDVHKIYVGHSIVAYPSLFGNMMFIDTGAYCNGRLTAIDLTTEEAIVVQTEEESSVG